MCHIAIISQIANEVKTSTCYEEDRNNLFFHHFRASSMKELRYSAFSGILDWYGRISCMFSQTSFSFEMLFVGVTKIIRFTPTSIYLGTNYTCEFSLNYWQTKSVGKQFNFTISLDSVDNALLCFIVPPGTITPLLL